MATHHKIDATRSGSYNGMDYDAEYTITFAYRPGERDRLYLRNGDPGYQGYPAEIEFISINPPAQDDIAQQSLDAWAADWLDDHLDECIAIAEGYDERMP